MAVSTSQGDYMRYPIRVNFAGWESDTYTLQRCGWEFSASQDYCRLETLLMGRHRGLGLYMGFEPIDYRFGDIADPGRMRGRNLRATKVSCKIHVLNVPMDITKWEAVDMTPRMDKIDYQDIDSLKLFRPMPTEVESQEIIVDQASVSELMDIILKKQVKDQEKYHKWKQEEELLSNGGIIVPKVEAKIITIAR